MRVRVPLSGIHTNDLGVKPIFPLRGDGVDLRSGYAFHGVQPYRHE